jgi:Arc/MetJ family transcription regulator
MRTNIDIDDHLLDAAMRAGPYKTKKDAVEAGLKLLARQVAYRDILALRGKLHWDDAPQVTALVANAPSIDYDAGLPAGAAAAKSRKKK